MGNINNKLLGILALGLVAGPLAAHATTSTCTLGLDNVVCDLYESGGNAVIDLSPIPVNPGTVGIFETGQPSVYRDVLEFVGGVAGGLNGSTLYFWFGALPSGPYDVNIGRTGAVTSYQPSPNVYNVHHDAVVVPEPGTLALIGLGLAGLGLGRRRKTT